MIMEDCGTHPIPCAIAGKNFKSQKEVARFFGTYDKAVDRALDRHEPEAHLAKILISVSKDHTREERLTRYRMARELLDYCLREDAA